MIVRSVLFFNFILIYFLIFVSVIQAGITGKIAGKIIDADNYEPLPGVNIIIEGITLGAASDLEGYYMILNIPPGIYTVKASMVGYQEMKVINVKVSTDLTTTIDFSIKPTVLELGEVVIVTAERPLIQKDLTSTLSVVGADDISEMPVEEFKEVLEMQAGVIEDSEGATHIRGGRSDEIAYLVDGITVTDPFSGRRAVEIENNAIQELQVISGTFNAEYGQAMSGIVNIVTKEGRERVSGQVSLYAGDYISNNKETFLNIDDLEPFGLFNTEVTLNGPIPGSGKRIVFYTSARFYNNKGWLYGQRIFNTTDSSNFNAPDPADWYIEQTGNNAFVSMNPYKKISFQGKLTYKISSNVKLSYNLLWDNIDYQNYYHRLKYNPDGNYKRYRKGYNHSMIWNHTLSDRTFYTINVSNFSIDYRRFVYENPHDSRYVDPKLFSVPSYTFYTGGTRMEHYYRNTKTWVGKFDITSQINKSHQIKTGVEVKRHKLYLQQFELDLRAATDWKPVIPPLSSVNHDQYTHYPIDGAAYIQDKIELEDMIVNAGFRFDYFNPDGVIPTDFRDPANSKKMKAKLKYQFSPRVGIAYPISEKGTIHFSYGHFFQNPPYEFLYADPEFEVQLGGLDTRMGNADLEPQRTVIYEIGLQQQIAENIGMDVTGFYKDIRNLLGTEIYELYSLGDRYARYINRDYGNVRGFTVSIKKRRAGYLSAAIDYTYQVAEGNASDPDAVFYDNASYPPRESEKQVVPLDWDQTHTLNVVATLSKPKSWGFSILAKLGSGFPYTPTEQRVRTSFENSERKPFQYTFDIKTHKDFQFLGLTYSMFLKIYNLFDTQNESDVYTDTGRAGYSLIPHYVPNVGIFPADLDDYLNRPHYYSEPRRVILGFSMEF
jgi:outer membrane receptor for ferrienterochelin and colicin